MLHRTVGFLKALTPVRTRTRLTTAQPPDWTFFDPERHVYSVALCTEVFDPRGGIMLEATPNSELSAISRRVSRTATLDGGATIEDLGYTASDSTLNLTTKIASLDIEERLLRLIRIYPTLTLATRYGAFLGVVDYYKPQAGGASLRFLVQRQLSL